MRKAKGLGAEPGDALPGVRGPIEAREAAPKVDRHGTLFNLREVRGVQMLSQGAKRVHAQAFAGSDRRSPSLTLRAFYVIARDRSGLPTLFRSSLPPSSRSPSRSNGTTSTRLAPTLKGSTRVCPQG